MIFGRPTTLWLGLVTAGTAFAQVVIVTLIPEANPAQVATILGALGLLLGALIALIANQPPTLNVGDKYVVTTPSGDPNVVKVANTNLQPVPPTEGNG
jgi:hypothetical protein